MLFPNTISLCRWPSNNLTGATCTMHKFIPLPSSFIAILLLTLSGGITHVLAQVGVGVKAAKGRQSVFRW